MSQQRSGGRNEKNIKGKNILRALLFGTKVAALVSVVLGCALGGILWLFFRVAGHELHGVVSRLHAFDGVSLAREVEPLLTTGHLLEGDAVRQRLATAEGRSLLRFNLAPADVAITESRRTDGPWSGGPMAVAGRACWVEAGPRGRVWVPIVVDDSVVAHLTVSGPGHARAIHLAFRRGVGHIALITLVGIVLVTAYLIRPLRRMATSMDRIAAGDLDHRVTVHGRDDVAAMGRSFNTMADRIGAMIQGQKELLADVSHELRSPLARMNVGLALLREPVREPGRDPVTDAAARDRRLDDLEAEVETIDHLVGEVLLASRFDLDAVPITPQTLDLAETVALAWRRLDAKGATPPVVTTSAGAERVSADPSLVARIVRNLLENAVRHAEKGHVTVVAERRGDRVDITVADNGPGVDENARKRLFEPFYRADPARTHEATGGFGLGLMIVRRAVEAHGGTVRADASEQGGLAVVFDLPAVVG